MKKFFAIALLAGLGTTLFVSDAQAFGGRRKKNKDCCVAPAPVVMNTGCGGCGGAAYGPAPVRYGANYGTPVYYGNTYSTPVYQTAYATPCGGVTYGTIGGTYSTTSGYTPPVAMPSTGITTATTDKPGTITIMVPSADAQVWFDENLVTQTGKERSLTTGNLADGKSYDYVVKAKWTDDSGKKVEKSKTVTVKAGQTATADFR